MGSLKQFPIAAFNGATVAVGDLAIHPMACTLPRSFEDRWEFATVCWTAGWAYYEVGDYASAAFWWQKADRMAAVDSLAA